MPLSSPRIARYVLRQMLRFPAKKTRIIAQQELRNDYGATLREVAAARAVRIDARRFRAKLLRRPRSARRAGSR